MRAWLRRPLRDAAELEKLRAESSRATLRSHRQLRVLLVVAAILVGANLVTTAFDSTLETSERVFSLVLIAVAFLVWTPAAVGRAWLVPRLVVAQCRLLVDRGLLPDGGSRELEESLADSLERARKSGVDGHVLRPIDLALKAVVLQLDPCHEASTDLGQPRAILEKLRLDLASLEIDLLLMPGRDSRAAWETELRRAGRLLCPGSIPKSGEPPTEKIASSIAVLPFADLSPEGDQEYFCHGLAEELIAALAQIEGLRVIARTSSFSLQSARRDAREIGRRLEVAKLVDGSVRKAGNRVRITVQLISTEDGRHLWSKRYDRTLDDIFAIQEEITAALIAHLQRGEVKSRRHKKVDLAAFQLYLKGRHLWNQRSSQSLTESAEVFARAAARDPLYALARAGLADAWNLLGYYSLAAPHEAFPRAIAAASEALELDAELAEAHASSAFANLLYSWDFEAAESSFRSSLELNPGYTTGHHWFAEYLTLMGRHERALEHAERALDLDPLSPIINVLLGWVFYYGRQYQEAIEALTSTLELHAEFSPAEFWLGLAYEQVGLTEKAAAALSCAVEHSGNSAMTTAALGRLKAKAGDPAEAERVLGELEIRARSSYVPSYYRAAVHSGRGDQAATFECLERAREERDNWLVFLNVDPIWDELRSDSRFAALVARIGL